MRYAGIDVGTNTVKLLVADVTPEGRVQRVLHTLGYTRLGEGLAASGRICEAAADRTVKQVRTFAEKAAELGAEGIVAMGMQSFRKASNARDVIARLKTEANVELRVVTGEEEAELGIRGVLLDFPASEGPYVLIDIGGGSTEMTWTDGTRIESCSAPEASVTLTEQFVKHDPPDASDLEALQNAIQARVVKPMLELKARAAMPQARLVGVGGTVTTAASTLLALVPFDSDRIHRFRFTRSQLRSLLAKLASLPLVERRTLPGLPTERADVIIGGGSVLLQIMTELHFAECTVSESGLLHAAVARAAVRS